MAVFKLVIVQTTTREVGIESSLDAVTLKERIEQFTDQLVDENDADYEVFANWKETWSPKTVTIED